MIPATRRPRRLLSLEELEPRIMLANDLLLPAANPARQVFAVPGLLGQTVPVRFTVTMRDAAFRNELGVAVVDDAGGRIGNLRPEDPGYAAAALASPSHKVLFSGRPNAGDTKTVKLPAHRHFIFFFVQNATANNFLARNPDNRLDKTPPVFFSIVHANPDGIKHMREKPANVFGFEDIVGGGDKDYNDMAVRMNIGTPTGTPAPPRLAGRLSNDTAPGGTTNTDRITFDPSIAGALTAGRKIIRFRAGFDAAPVSTYVSLLNDRGPSGSFLLDQARINQIAGGLLGDGPHVLHLTAKDEADKVAKLDLAFTLDTTAPLNFDLAAEFDSTPLGDQQTTFESVTLRGQAEPGAVVMLQETGATTTAAGTGGFEFPGVHLTHGPNDFTVAATDVAGNSSTASRTITHIHCGFDSGLTDWTVATSGGSGPDQGSVTVDGSDAVLREGNSLLVTLERTFTVPAEVSQLKFIFSGPAFDVTDTDSIKDAFEVALLDAGGAPLVFPFVSDRDAFFNISEAQSPALGIGTTIDGQTVTTELSGLTPGSTFRLVFRLVNNDSDTETTVRINCVEIVSGGSPPPAGIAGRLASLTARQALDFSLLSDVSGSLEAEYARTSFDEAERVLNADMGVHNNGQYEVAGPLLAVVRHLSDPSVRVRDFDGLTPDGLPYYDFTDLLDNGRLLPGETTLNSGESSYKRIAFFSPDGAQFSYDLVFLAQLNRAPAFTSVADVEALAERPYVYHATAADPDGDTLSYSLLIGPAGMAIDGDSGAITWDPTTNDVGNHAVAVRVEDGRGGFDLQHYTLAVRDNVPNRPPVFASAPPVDGFVNRLYTYLPIVTDEDGDVLHFSLPASLANMTIDADTGEISWTPSAIQLGQHYVSLTVDDGRGGSATQTFTINVAPEPGNHAPVIVSDPPTRFAVELPGTPTGDVSPDLISLAIDEQRTEHISVRVPPAIAIGSIDLLPASIDTSAMTTDAQTLQVTGTVRIDVRNQGTDAYESSTAGIFEVLVFEDRDGDAAFTRGLDNVLGTATFAGSIAAGAEVSMDVPLAGIIQFLDKPIWVFVDAGDAIPELDEVNNTLATGLDSRYQPTDDWLPMVQWQWRSTNSLVWSAATVAPLIDTNGDGRIDERDVPAVIVNDTADLTSRLVALRGDTGQVIFDVPVPAGISLRASAPTVGDLDGDGRPEFLLQNYQPTAPFYAFNNDGTLKWTSQPTTYYSDLVLVDLDGDGKSEILRGTAAFNFDGTIRWDSRQVNIVGGNYLGGPQLEGNARQPVDLNLDGIPEIVASASALDRDGKSLWQWTTPSTGAGDYIARLSVNGGPYVNQFVTNVPLGSGNSWTAVANLDDDPFPEIIVVSPLATSFAAGGLWIFNHDGSLFAPPVGLLEHISNDTLGAPTVADFDGDGRPEIAIAVKRQQSLTTFADPNRTILYVFETDGTEVWHKDLTARQANFASLPTAFDFDGDGAAELVFQDAQYLYILDGRDGATRFQFGITSQDLFPSMYPVIADVDNDGAAEIVAFTENRLLVGAPPRQGIVVLGDANDNWIHARRIWNQWLYNPAYVNQDGSIPIVAASSLLAGSGKNSLREQVPIDGVDLFAAPDLSVSQVTVDAANCPISATLTARVGNGGSLQAGPGVRVNFYLGDPAAGGRLLGYRSTSNPLFPGEFEDVSFEWTAPAAGLIVVTVNETPPATRIVSSNLSLVANTWAKANGFQSISSVPVNQVVFRGIDGQSNTIWTPNAPNTDPGPNYYEVHLPFPVEVSSVTIQNASTTNAFLGTGTLTFSNGFSTSINLSATGAGSVSFPEQTGITWIRLMATAAGTTGAGLAEFIIGGSYVQPPFLMREGDGRLGNNSASLVLNEEPCAAANPPPLVEAGPDQTVFDGDTVSLNPASFTDPVLLETHTATIDWGDGTAVEQAASLLSEANNSGTISGAHQYAAEGTYVVTVTVFDSAGNSDADTFTVAVLNANLREPPIDVIASDPAVAFVNLTGPLAGIGQNQVAEFDVRLTGTAAPSRSDILFVKHGVLLGSIPVTVNDTYRYAVQALDGDGDPITYRLLQGPAGAAIDAAGVITWTPDRPGAYSFLVEAADNRGGVTTQVYILNVNTGTNQSPMITSTQPARAIVNRDLSYLMTATDPDGDNLSFFLTSAPAGMGIDSATGVVTWRPAVAQLGTHTVTVSVRDVRGGLATQTFDLDVTRDITNGLPAITSTPLLIADPGVLYRYQVTATDPENDSLRFDLPLKPAGMTIHPSSGILTWRPAELQMGVHDVIVRVRDSQDGVTLQHYQVTVREANALPVIVSAPPPQALAGLPFEYRMRGQDTAGEPLTYHLDAGPAGAAIDADMGVLLWIPTAAQIGTQSLTVAVRDERGGEATQTFNVEVAPTAPNDPPPILSTPRTTIALDGHYVYQVQAIDANADPLTYTLATMPAGMTVDAFGLVTWDPTPGQFGANAVELHVSDGRGGDVVQSFMVDVVSTPQNQSPVITSTPPSGAILGRLYAYDLQATDPDGDPLMYSLVSGPRGMSIHPDLGTLRWLPAADQIGAHDVVVQVLDAQGGSAVQSFPVIMRSLNTPPVITSSPVTEAAVDVLSTDTVRALDRDGDHLTFSLQTFPSGMTIDPASGLIQWTPTDQQVGPQQVVVVVDDGLGGTATHSYTVVATATPANLAPVITSTPTFVATVGTEYDYQIVGNDPEGQALEFLLLQGPAGMFLDPAVSGLLRWTPAPSQLGAATVTVAARDPAGATAVQSFATAVADNNSAPMIRSRPVLAATARVTYLYDIQATDPDADLLRYDLEVAPAGMSLDVRRTGGQGQVLSGIFAQLTWTPGVLDLGTTQTVRVRVTDPRGLSATQSFDVTVAADTQAPRVSLQVNPNPINIGSTATVIVSATDDVDVQTLNLTVNGTPVALDTNGRGSVIMSQAGLFDVLATAMDAAGNTGTASATLLVIDPSVTGAPVVSLSSPADGGDITAPTDVIGTANDDNLAFYTLSVAPLGSRSFTEIARGTTPVIDGVLGRFDPTLLANDSYVLQLTATDTGGNTATVERTVNVSGNLKLGNFTLSFTDMSVPVAGIPIQVTRTYDTLEASQNSDLGFGWRLEFRSTGLRTTVAKTGLEPDGIYNGLRDGSKVYITLPGGKREGFTFRPQAGRFVLVSFFHPVWVPDRGVTSRLTTKDAKMRKRGDEYVEVFTGLPYNPADSTFGGEYKLTTKDGTEYQIDGSNGRLNTVTDRSGNTLSFSEGGIVSSTGAAVTFARDPQGRIVAVTDPMGNAVRYEYDSRGDLAAVRDREDNTTRFVYSTARAHFLEEVIDPLGRSGARTEYDDQGRMVRLVNGNGEAVQVAHDLANATETVLDARGNPTTFEYDERGNILTEINPLGGITRRTYDGDDNILTKTDPLGNTTVFTYDAAGNLLSDTNPIGATRRYIYGPNSQLVNRIDALGNSAALTLDDQGNPVAGNLPAGGGFRFSSDGAGNQTMFGLPNGGNFMYTYDQANRPIRRVDPLGNETTWTYDANGNQLTETIQRTIGGALQALTTSSGYDGKDRLVLVTDRLGGTWRFEYDEFDRETARVDPLGRRTSSVYDVAGRLIRKNFPDGTFEVSEYDAAGNKIAQTDTAGRTTRFQYDALNRLTTTIFPDDTPNDATDNPRSLREFDAAGHITADIDANGQRTQYEYDPAGRRIRTIQPAVFDVVQNQQVRHEFKTEYDAAGNRLAIVDANGQRTQFAYDAANRRIGTTFADGTSLGVAYDALGQVLARTDQAGETTSYAYDPLGNLISVTLPPASTGQTPVVTHYSYDEGGNLLTQSDALGRTTRFGYDELGRQVSHVLPMGQTETFAYDAVGNLTRRTDFNGDTTTMQYDEMDELVRKLYSDGSAMAFTYTPTGRQQSIVDARGTTTFTYDAQDRLVSRTEPDGRTISYAYDAAGNRTSVSTPVGVTAYAFDALNRLLAVTDPSGGITQYGYDAVGNLVRTLLPNGTAETRQYDDLHRLVFLENTGASGVISSYHYTLGPTGMRTAVLENTGRQVAYTYDAVDRLIGESITDPVGGNRTIDYSYDAVGNRLTRDDSAEGVTTYSYDDNDRLLTETLAGDVARYTYDARGNMLSKSTNATDQAFYNWDFEGRLVGADMDGNGALDAQYQYDAEGNRVVETINGQETRFLLDSNRDFAQVVMESTPAGVISGSYVYGLDLISQNRGAVTSFYHVDGLGSTTALTDASGIVTDQYLYDAFGRMLTRFGASENRYLFTGEQFDPHLGVNYLRARYYDFATGRFLSTDPFQGSTVQPETLHRYIYAGNDPVNNLDPSGKFFSLLSVSIGVGIAAGLTAFGFTYHAGYSFLAAAGVGLAVGVSFFYLTFVVGGIFLELVGTHALVTGASAAGGAGAAGGAASQNPAVQAEAQALAAAAQATAAQVQSVAARLPTLNEKIQELYLLWARAGGGVYNAAQQAIQTNIGRLSGPEGRQLLCGLLVLAPVLAATFLAPTASYLITPETTYGYGPGYDFQEAMKSALNSRTAGWGPC